MNGPLKANNEHLRLVRAGRCCRPIEVVVMAEAPSELAARQLEHGENAVLSSFSCCDSGSFEKDLTNLELRQAAILDRISCLCQSLSILKCEIIRTQDSCENVGGGHLSWSGSSSGGVLDENAGCEFEADDPGKLGGETWSTKRNGVISPTSNRTIHDVMGRCHGDDSPGQGVEQRLTQILRKSGATFLFRRVPSDYYGRSFEERRDLLGAASVDHLCKSIVMVNTQAHESVRDCSDCNNSKYYLVVVQYTARLNAEKVRHFVYTLNDGKISKKRFNLRLAPEEDSNSLTGFEHNAVTPIGMLTNIPVILSDAVVKLKPEFFWLGGGEVDLKLGIGTNDFLKIINPFVVDCIY